MLTGPVKSSGVWSISRMPAVELVVDVAEGARLHAVAVERDVLALQRLDDEVRHHAAVVGMHARPIGVEDARHLDAQLVLAVIVEEQRLGAALALVVAGARPERIDVAAIALDLGMHGRVAIDLAGRGLEDLRPHPLGQPQHVDRAVDRGLGRLHRIVLVVDRRGRAGEVVDLVDLDVEREGHVVPHQLELRMAETGSDVVLVAREVVVDAQHVVARRQQALAKMRAQEARAAGHQNSSTHGAKLLDLEMPLVGRPMQFEATAQATKASSSSPKRALQLYTNSIQ